MTNRSSEIYYCNNGGNNDLFPNTITIAFDEREREREREREGEKVFAVEETFVPIALFS